MLTMHHINWTDATTGTKYRGVVETTSQGSRIALWARWSSLIRAFVIEPIPPTEKHAELIEQSQRCDA